jgi:two-component system NtrC family sensor kinase
MSPEIASAIELSDCMRLTRKFIAALVIGVALVAMVQSYFAVTREHDVFDKQMRAEATALGRALARGVADVWTRDGEAAATQFLITATSQSERLQTRWFWLNAKAGHQPKAPPELLEPILEGQVVTLRDDERKVLLTYIPVDVPEPLIGGLEIAQSLNEIDTYTKDSVRNEVIGSSSAVAIAAVLALGLGVVFIGRPISRLAAKARRVGTGDLTGPLELGQRDELGELASEINLMCERLAEERSAREAATVQLRHADRLTTVGKLASGLAHELGTPLNVVNGRAKLIVDGEVEGAEAVASARVVCEQAERMTKLIRQLLDFARPPRLHIAPVNIPALASRVCELVATIARKANVTLWPPPPDGDLRVEADDGQLTQVLTNLLVNAIQAMPESGGTVTISARVERRIAPAYVSAPGERAWMAIAVKDTGNGMDDATRERIFEPFFTTKEVGEGTGLGLSVSWGIAREHGGWIDVRAALHAGATFTIYVPMGARA